MKRVLKDGFVLLLITLVAGFALALVQNITAEPIARAEQEAKEAIYRTVFPDATAFVPYDAVEGVEELVAVTDQNGESLGYAVTVLSKNGYGGEIKAVIGVGTDGKLIAFRPLSHSETAGYGARMEDTDVQNQFVGITAGTQLDGIAGATYTTGALRELVDAALWAVGGLNG